MDEVRMEGTRNIQTRNIETFFLIVEKYFHTLVRLSAIASTFEFCVFDFDTFMFPTLKY